jgi:hypothetical protein
MKRSLYIWLTIAAGLVLLTGVLVSGSGMMSKTDEPVAIKKVDNSSCAEKCAASAVKYASTKEAPGSCPYTSACASGANAVHASTNSGKCTYTKSDVKMAKEVNSDNEQPALTSVE